MSLTQSNNILQIRDLFEEARKERQKGDIKKALDAWRKIIRMTDDTTDREALQARMASSSESAVALQELGDTRSARDLLSQAVQVAETLQRDGQNGKPQDKASDAMAMAGVLINLAGLYITAREASQGCDVADRALTVIEPYGAHAATGLLRFAAHLQRGTGKLLLRQAPEAEADLRIAVQVGITLVGEGQAQLLLQLVEASGRLFAAAKAQGKPEAALQEVEQVARIAAASFEASGAPALQLFVNAQMHRINALLDVHRFAEAEDQLWHLIDGSGDGSILMSAPDFYFSLWQREDTDLAQGGLPRAEVAESWRDAIAQTEQRDPDPMVIEIMKQRCALHVDGANDQVAQFLAQQEAKSDHKPLVATLLQRLKQEHAQVSSSV